MFCPAGMQKYKDKFKDTTLTGTTLCNIQSCVRLNDIESMGDGTHLGLFGMLGTFSFRYWSVQQTVDYWMTFLSRIGIKVDYTTVHPDKLDWSKYHSVEVKTDPECKWTDGEIGGYCTEFYTNGIEIGNIVNPLGTCIDVGFGLERLDQIVNQTKPLTREESMRSVIIRIIEEGYRPSHRDQGYLLKKLLRELVKMGGTLEDPLFYKEKERQSKMKDTYTKLVVRYPNQTKEWWYTTHGIDLPLLHM